MAKLWRVSALVAALAMAMAMAGSLLSTMSASVATPIVPNPTGPEARALLSRARWLRPRRGGCPRAAR